MADEKHEAKPTQTVHPKKGEPFEIPVPKHGEFDRLVRVMLTPPA